MIPPIDNAKCKQKIQAQRLHARFTSDSLEYFITEGVDAIEINEEAAWLSGSN